MFIGKGKGFYPKCNRLLRVLRLRATTSGTDIFDRFKQKQKESLNERAVCSSLTIL